MTSTKLDEMTLPQIGWAKRNRRWIGVGRFHASMHKWGVAPSPNYECGSIKQAAETS